MRTDIPASIGDTAHDLAPGALATLFKIELVNGTLFYFSPFSTVTWLGIQYDEIACSLSGLEQSADGKVSRPRFTFANPGGLFTQDLYHQRMDNAILTRIRMMRSDLEANNNFALKESFRVKRVMNVNNQMAVVELRDVLDGRNFFIPARSYTPPEFSHVRL